MNAEFPQLWDLMNVFIFDLFMAHAIPDGDGLYADWSIIHFMNMHFASEWIIYSSIDHCKR